MLGASVSGDDAPHHVDQRQNAGADRSDDRRVPKVQEVYMIGKCFVCAEYAEVLCYCAKYKVCYRPSCRKVWKVIDSLPDHAATDDVVKEIVRKSKEK